MATATTILLSMSGEAAEHIAALGLQHEFDAIVQHAKETVPGLRSIEIKLSYAPWMSPDPAVLIYFHRMGGGEENDTTDDIWTNWMVETFPPEVCIAFPVLTVYEKDDGR